MNRRHAFSSLGLGLAATTATLATKAFGQGDAASAPKGALGLHKHDPSQDHCVSTALTPQAAGKPNVKLADTAADCVVKGQVCLNHCLSLLASGDKGMAKCARTVNQMLALCTALQSLSAQGAELLPALAKTAADACSRCAEACKPHVHHHAECKACYEACQACIKQCKLAA
jgi:Cys-rich four helix bundle protein (predicted Tat secretion target)